MQLFGAAGASIGLTAPVQPARQRAAVAHPIIPVIVEAARRRIQTATEPLNARVLGPRSCPSCCSMR